MNRMLALEALRGLLGPMLRGIRTRRKLTNREVARRMGMEARSFERFASGEVRVEIDRLFAFARATNSDPFAIIASIYFNSPELAERCADNKLMLVHVYGLERLSQKLGDRLQRVDAATMMDVYERFGDEMVREVDEKDARERAWFYNGESDPE